MKTILVGEIGLSHEGSLGLALSMIDSCKEAQLDYVKFQYHQSEYESTENETFRINSFPQDSSRYDYWQRTSFRESEWKLIINHCSSIGIGFLCTPFSVWAANQLVGMGLKEVKISSGDANNWELLEFVKQNFLKIIVSVGMSTHKEVISLIEFMSDYQGEFLLMQCTSEYPVTPNSVGLNYLREIHKLIGRIGLSDHSGNPLVSIAAIANGASMVEFHVVFSKKQFGPDTSSSITFEEANLVSQFRDLYPKLFDSNYDKDSIANSLSELRTKFGRGLSLKKGIDRGQSVSIEMLTLKKPLGPLSWADRSSLEGKRAIRTISSSEHIAWNDFI